MAHWKEFLDAEARGGRYLPWKEVARATGLSRTTAWRLQKRDEFPAPYAISPGRVGYREDEVEAWRISRDHSAARVKSPVDLGAGQAARDSPAAAAARSATAPPKAEAGSSADRDSDSVLVVTRSPPRGLPDMSVGRRKAGRRRRSQHAQAIAQQILFDF